jgi:hypothetical protein
MPPVLQMFSGHIGTDELAAVALSNTVRKPQAASTLCSNPDAVRSLFIYKL